MDRIIEVRVNGNYLTKDNDLAGVQHEANVTSLRITFDEGWDGYAKKVTWWNAYGLNPVERTLTADLLEDITESIRTYLVPIPGEPLEVAGRCTFVIDGYVEGKRQRSVQDTLKVKAADFVEQADEPVDPTPTQAEQLQVQIDTLLGDMQAEAIRAETAAESAETAQAAAETAQKGAEAAQEAAEQSAQAAADSASAAAQSADGAAASEEAAKQAAETAAEETAGALERSMAGHVSAAQEAEANAKAAQEAAEAARDSAKEIVGGDFATVAEVTLSVETAESNANTYTDKKIEEHNTGAESHADIRAAVAAADNVFWATYGVTTSAEIEAAYQAQKLIFCNYTMEGSDRVFLMDRRAAENLHVFRSASHDWNRTLSCYADEWEAAGENYTPSYHAGTHAADGEDPITPAAIGAEPAGTATSAVGTHNSSTTAHSDIRTLVSNAASAAAAAQAAADSKAPAYTYGTADIEAGSASTAATGTLHFIYE